MKNTILITLLIVFGYGCKKENSNRNNTIISNTPKSIIYQDLDTTTGNYITTQTFYLFPDTAGIYFDSVQIQDPVSSDIATAVFHHVYFNSKKYLFYDNFLGAVDSNDVAVIKFDNDNRITKLHDRYSLLLDEPTYTDDWSNNGLGYGVFSSNSILSSFSTILTSNASVTDFSYNFDVIAANSDSMKIESGRNHDQGIYDRALKYTVLFDNKHNNTNLIQLSGYLFNNFGNLNNATTNIFKFVVSKIPFAKSTMNLVKTIYITENQGESMYKKYADFSYEFDSDNRVTKATIQNYYFDGFDFVFPNVVSSKRILFTY